MTVSSLKNRVILITGGSRGLRREMALALAEADGDCAKMLLSAGLVDRDLGKSSVGALRRIL